MNTLNTAVVRRTLYELRWHIFWYGIGTAIYAASMVFLFPAFRDVLEETEYPEDLMNFFGGAGDMGEPEVFLQTEYLSFVPIILVIYAVIGGTGLFAGDEGRGTLETTLALPISRTRLYWSRVGALLAGLLVICAINAVGWAVSVPFVDLDGLGLATLVGASFAVIPLVAAFGGLSVLVAAIAPTRAMAGGLMAMVAIVSYLLASFANTIEAIEWARWITPYFYADTSRILTDGVVWWHQAVLVLIAVVSFVLGLVAFNAREIGATTWQPRAITRGWRLA